MLNCYYYFQVDEYSDISDTEIYNDHFESELEEWEILEQDESLEHPAGTQTNLVDHAEFGQSSGYEAFQISEVDVNVQALQTCITPDQNTEANLFYGNYEPAHKKVRLRDETERDPLRLSEPPGLKMSPMSVRIH